MRDSVEKVRSGNYSRDEDDSIPKDELVFMRKLLSKRVAPYELPRYILNSCVSGKFEMPRKAQR